MELMKNRKEKLTGRTRGRPNLFGRRLTMQVEVQVWEAEVFALLFVPPKPDCADLDAWKRRQIKRAADAWIEGPSFWRDATWADQLALLEIQLKENTK